MWKKNRRKTVTDVSSPLFDEMDNMRTCTSKKPYDSEWQAKFAVTESMDRFGISLETYKCPYCDKWHLTGNP